MSRPSDMQPAHAEPVRLTYDDYVRFPDDGRRHELIDGEHIVTPAPTRRHQDVSMRLANGLFNYLTARPIGWVYAAPIDVILSNFDVVQPDILVVLNERAHVLGTWIHGAPDIAVEILSPSSRRLDEKTKQGVYDRFGVREYWIVDPEAQTVRVYRRAEDGSFPHVADFSGQADDTIETPLLPGFSVALRYLFAE